MGGLIKRFYQTICGANKSVEENQLIERQSNISEFERKHESTMSPSETKILTKSDSNYNLKTTKTPHEFVWKYGGNRVILTGSFDNWNQSVQMTRDQSDSRIFRATVILDPEALWRFKFVVDGVWRCSLDFDTETDSAGNVNNIWPPTK